eukprot:129402-Rhodomonas_salina.2
MVPHIVGQCGASLPGVAGQFGTPHRTVRDTAKGEQRQTADSTGVKTDLSHGGEEADRAAWEAMPNQYRGHRVARMRKH